MPDRSSYGKLGAHESWSRTEDRQARTKPARDAAFERFEREVDPDGKLDPEERAYRAKHAQQAHMIRMALASAESRRQAYINAHKEIERRKFGERDE